MFYSVIKKNDIANGLGVRIVLFVSGCRNHCENCFQPQTWSFDYGKPFTKETEDYIMDLLKPSYVAGLTLLGGEPFEPENQKDLLPFVKRVKEELPDKNIWAFTGFTLDNEILKQNGSRASTPIVKEFLSYIDVLVDGRYVDKLRDLRLKFRGSSNQRIILVDQTLKTGQIVLSDLN